MSKVVSMFRFSVGVAFETPLHAGVVFISTLVATLVALVFGLIPLVGPLVSGVLVTPLMLAAVLGSANAARLGESPVAGFGRGLSDAGMSLVGAFALLYAGYAAVGLVLGIFGAVAVVLTVGIGSGVDPAAGSAVGGVMSVLLVAVFGVFFVAVLLVALTLQFVGPAAVVAGTGAVDSLKTSYRFFRRNLRGALGFSALTFGVILLAYGLVAAAFAVGYFAVSDLAGVALGAVVYFLGFVPVGAVLTVYQVTYFDAVADETVLPAVDGGDGTVRPADADGSH